MSGWSSPTWRGASVRVGSGLGWRPSGLAQAGLGSALAQPGAGLGSALGRPRPGRCDAPRLALLAAARGTRPPRSGPCPVIVMPQRGDPTMGIA